MTIMPIAPRVTVLVLLLEGPSFGLDLARRAKEKSYGAVTIRQGSLYTVLRELEGEGLVEPVGGAERGPGGKPRQYVRLTPEGRRQGLALKAVLASLLNVTVERGPRVAAVVAG